MKELILMVAPNKPHGLLFRCFRSLLTLSDTEIHKLYIHNKKIDFFEVKVKYKTTFDAVKKVSFLLMSLEDLSSKSLGIQHTGFYVVGKASEVTTIGFKYKTILYSEVSHYTFLSEFINKI